jgi:exonuclease SbcC
LPEPAPSQDLERAEAEVVAARMTRDTTAAAVTAARADQRGATERLLAVSESLTTLAAEDEVVATELDEARAAVEAGHRQLREVVGAADPVVGLEALRTELRLATTAAADARKLRDQVRREHDQAIRDEQGTAREVAQLRLALADLSARLNVDAEFGETPAELGAGLDDLRQQWTRRSEDLDQQIEAAQSAASAAAAARGELLGDLEIAGDFAAAIADVRAQIELRTAALKRDEAEIAAADEVRSGHGRLIAEQGRYRRIATDLTDSRFVRFLLDEERARLAELGSDHFQRLSSGRYRFSDGGRFDVVDLTTADAERKADSLSGGETFLASLALALALAEMVARTGGRLDSFFLDEGFGALDPEHLDLAMEGIEALVAEDRDRLVVVVSHVPELRHRIEDLIELDRDPTTGDTRVLSD